METRAEKSRRVAKNTLFLYLRTAITLVVSLYTSRLILNILGVDNYGVYNIIGGTISLLSILTGSLSGSISRFITFGLGKNDIEKSKLIFSTSLNIQIGLSILIIIIAETVGLWLLNHELNIPAGSMKAAFWVLQFSVATFVTGLISVPYEASIIAHEDMKLFAYIGIIEVVLKLLFVLLLYLTSSYTDRLITYSFLLFLIALILRIIYGRYCKRKFRECRFKAYVEKSILIDMFGFSVWSFLGNSAYIFNTQGVNILINIFFGVTLNAARGIVAQVESAIMKFVDNFTTAITPQITKSYASGERDYMFALICKGTKFSYFLLLLFLVPIELETEMVLKLWLKIVPDDTALFLRLSLIGSATILLGSTCLKAIFATGIIRNYMITVTLVGCLVFPITWMMYKAGLPAYVTYIIYIGIYTCINGIRLIFMRKILGFPIIRFVRDALLPITYVSIGAIFIPLIIFLYMESSIVRFLIVSFTSVVCTGLSVYFMGLTINERSLALKRIQNIKGKLLNNEN